MKSLAPLLLLLVASCGTTRITAVGGKADFGNDLDPVEEHSVGGLEVSSGPKGGGFGFELGGHYGHKSSTSVSSESYEYYAGPRYEWRLGDWSPFLSAGLSDLRVRSSSSGTSSMHDTDLGFYAAVGTDYHFGHGWHLGLSLRKTMQHDLVFQGTSGDADAWQYLLRFGWAH